jgi:hypothetical protein
VLIPTDWHTIEAHESFKADKKREEFVEMFASAKDGNLQGEVIHVSWAVSEALPCLEAPVTEIRKVNARVGVTLEAVQATLDKYVRYVMTKEAVGATYGPVVENPEEIGLVIGWKTIKVRTFSCGVRLGLNGEMVGVGGGPTGRGDGPGRGDKEDNRRDHQRRVKAV